MFGGKREKALEETLRAAKESEQIKQTAFEQITEQRDDILERFAHMTASRSEMERRTERLKEQLEHIAVLSENGNQAAGTICGALRDMENGVECFDAEHAAFLDGTKAWSDKIMEIVEKNKHFTTPMKYISETAQGLSGEQEKLHGHASRMTDFSKNMGVLALNCAIEAGRMGESGRNFVAAAEEIRALCEQHEQEAGELTEQLNAADARAAELAEQVHHLNELLKENNNSMRRLLGDSTERIAAYESKQRKLRELMPDAIVGKADALQQSVEECAGTEARMLQEAGDLLDELQEQKQSADELENICQGVLESARSGFEA